MPHASDSKRFPDHLAEIIKHNLTNDQFGVKELTGEMGIGSRRISIPYFLGTLLILIYVIVLRLEALVGYRDLVFAPLIQCCGRDAKDPVGFTWIRILCDSFIIGHEIGNIFQFCIS